MRLVELQFAADQLDWERLMGTGSSKKRSMALIYQEEK